MQLQWLKTPSSYTHPEHPAMLLQSTLPRLPAFAGTKKKAPPALATTTWPWSLHNSFQLQLQPKARQGTGTTNQHSCTPDNGFWAVDGKVFQAWLGFFSSYWDIYLRAKRTRCLTAALLLWASSDVEIYSPAGAGRNIPVYNSSCILGKRLQSWGAAGSLWEQREASYLLQASSSMWESGGILMQILLPFNKSILLRGLSLRTVPGLQQADLSQLNSQTC